MFRCGGCGLCFAHPAPSPEQLAAMYDDNYTASADSAQACRNVAPIYFRKIAAFLPREDGFRFLEIGGSYGFLPALVQARTGAEGTLLEPGATAAQNAGALPIKVVQGYAEEYTPAEPFDVVFAAHVVEHVPDLERFFRACHRLLRPGGTLLLLTPNAAAWKLASFGAGWSWSAPSEHTHLLTRESARLICERVGFDLVATKTAVPSWRQYPYFLTRQLSFLLTRLIGRTPAVRPIAMTPEADARVACGPVTQSRKPGWKHYVRRSGRVILWAEYLSLSIVDRVFGLKRADELLIVARRGA